MMLSRLHTRRFLQNLIYMRHPRGTKIIIKMKNAAPRKLSCTQPRASHEIMKGVVLLVFPRRILRPAKGTEFVEHQNWRRTMYNVCA